MHRDDTRTYPHIDLHGELLASGESASSLGDRDLRPLRQSRASQESERERGLEQAHDRL